MTMTDGNAAQNRLIIEQALDAAVARFTGRASELPEHKVPTILKVAGSIVAALMTTCIIGSAIWLVTTVNTMQLTLARMDERQIGQSSSQEGRFAEIERRLAQLETRGRVGAEIALRPLGDRQ